MAELQGRKVFKVFNQDFIVDERYTVTKELGQGAYGIVWYVLAPVVDIGHRSLLYLSDLIHRLEVHLPPLYCSYTKFFQFIVRQQMYIQTKELQ